MASRLLALAALGACCSAAADVAADFEKACQAGGPECVDASEDMYLIQKHLEVGSSAMETTEHDAKGPTVTTKGGGKKKDKDDKGHPECPIGFTAMPGMDEEEDMMGEAPKSLASDMDSCAGDCMNHSSCGSFEFSKKEKKCLLSTRSNPKEKLSLSDNKYLFCSKYDNCTFVWPWAYFNTTHNIERNAWNAWNTAHRCWWEWFVWCLITWTIWVVLAVLAMKVWWGAEPDIMEDSEDPRDTLEIGHFDCMRRPKICCTSFICPAAMWALTMNWAGFLHVGVGFCIFSILCLIQGYASWTGILFPGLLTPILMLTFRQRLRSKLNCKPDTATSLWNDLVYVLFCPCCAVAQEAMVVQYAYSKGHMGFDAPKPREVTRVIREEPFGPPASMQGRAIRSGVVSQQYTRPSTQQFK